MSAYPLLLPLRAILITNFRTRCIPIDTTISHSPSSTTTPIPIPSIHVFYSTSPSSRSPGRQRKEKECHQFSLHSNLPSFIPLHQPRHLRHHVLGQERHENRKQVGKWCDWKRTSQSGHRRK